MARRKKSDTTSEGEAPERKNSELTEDEKRVLLYQHKGIYQAAKKKVDDAKAELLRVSKVAKAECGKDAVADIKDLILLEDDHGSAALQADIERKLRLARWAGAPVGTQFSFEEVDRRTAEDVARENGKIAGLKGEPCKPPHDPSVPQHQRWIEGWHAGQEVLMSDFRSKLGEGGSQMDLAERTDLPPEGDPPFNPADEPKQVAAE